MLTFEESDISIKKNAKKNQVTSLGQDKLIQWNKLTQWNKLI